MLGQLKQKKEKLSIELKEMSKKKRKESELNTIRSQIKGLETRLKYSITDRDNTVCVVTLMSVIISLCVVSHFEIKSLTSLMYANKLKEKIIRVQFL